MFTKLKHVNTNIKHVIGTYYFLECGKDIRVKFVSYLIESFLSVTKKCAFNSVRKINYFYCDTHTQDMCIHCGKKC